MIHIMKQVGYTVYGWYPITYCGENIQPEKIEGALRHPDHNMAWDFQEADCLECINQEEVLEQEVQNEQRQTHQK